MVALRRKESTKQNAQDAQSLLLRAVQACISRYEMERPSNGVHRRKLLASCTAPLNLYIRPGADNRLSWRCLELA